MSTLLRPLVGVLFLVCFWSPEATGQCPISQDPVWYSIGWGENPSEISWELQDDSGNPVYTGGAGESGIWCLNPGSYNFVGYDSNGDGWAGASAAISPYQSGNLTLAVTGSQGSIFFDTNWWGCTDHMAANYDPTATNDDGLCVYCDPGTFPLEISMFDAGGDGWSGAQYELYDNSTESLVASGSLNGACQQGCAFVFGDGLSSANSYVCLAPGCYTFFTTDDASNYEVSIGVSDFFGNYYGTFGENAVFPLDFALTGQCDIDGCTNPSATNFNASVTNDDGSCLFGGCTVPVACNYNPEATTDDGSCEFYCPGCTDELACNFDPGAIQDDGSCDLPPLFYNCDGVCITDSDQDGVCDELEVVGCTDPTACNFNTLATDDDGTCTGIVDLCGVCGGDDSSCSGCIDANACNYDSTAVWQPSPTDQGWLSIWVGGGSWDGDISWQIWGPQGGVIAEGAAPYAANLWIPYDIYVIELQDAYGDGWNGAVMVLESQDTQIFTIDDGSSATFLYVPNFGDVCEYPSEEWLDCNDNCLVDSDGDGICNDFDTCFGEIDECGVCAGPGAVYECGCEDIPTGDCDCNGTSIDGCGVCGGDNSSCSGCSYEFACNYDPAALIPDASLCEFGTCPGCTDPDACNYNPTVFDDDGSCEYSTCVFCGDPAAANYYPDADSFDNNICVYCDPGTFIFEVDMADSAGNGWSGCEYTLIDESTAEIVGSGSINESFLGNGLYTGVDYHCLAPGCYRFTTSEDAYPEEVSIALSDQFGIAYGVVGAGENYGVDFTLTGQCDFSGCTNPSSSNFNPSASVDDGSCIFESGVVFNVDMSCFTCEFENVVVSGPWISPIQEWFGFNVMTDDDGDGIYTLTVPNLSGTIEYFYAVNTSTIVENLSNDTENGSTCALVVNNNGYSVRQIEVTGIVTTQDFFGSCDGNCNDPEIACDLPGCTEPNACNFNADANDDDGSCEFPDPSYDCLGNCLNDSDGDGVCDELEVPGCLEPNACNFNPDATDQAECTFIQSEDCDCDGNQLDVLGVCGGGCLADGDNDGVCDDVDPCVGTYDSCGVCNGPGAVLDCGCADIPAGDCDCDGNTLDALGVCGGNCSSDGDGDGVCDNVDPCVGAYDVCGVCNGLGAVYECGCEDIPAGECDCTGNQLDALGVCGGLCNADLDADGICDEFDPCVGVFDECGVCNGPGASFDCGCADIPQGDCDCFGNQLDALDVCGGSCAEDGDGDGVCDDVDDCIGVIDECGVCNGLGAIYDCGCADIPDGDCDCFGNQMDLAGVCGGDCFDDDDMDGVCDDIETYGCTYPLAENYDPNAMDDDGSCLFPCEGVVNTNIFDWNEDGTITSIDLIMMLSVYGDTDVDFDGVWDSVDFCVDTNACNYDDDPSTSCAYLDALGLCGGGCAGDVDSDDLCDDVDDCVDPEACNFDALPTEPCAYLDALATCGGTCLDDVDGDGICDDIDDCIGVIDECGVCNGPGATEVTIESITILYDSVFADQIQAWLVFEVGADTTFSYTCPPAGGSMLVPEED